MNWLHFAACIVQTVNNLKRENVPVAGKILKLHGARFVLAALIKIFRPVHYVMNSLTPRNVLNTIISFQKLLNSFSELVVQIVLTILKMKG